MSKKIVGYTQGVYDLFHIGHLNLLKNAKSMCDELIVGVFSDEIVQSYKNHLPIIPQNERLEIVKSIKYVNRVVKANVRDDTKLYPWEKYKFDIFFVGNDWENTTRFKRIEKTLGKKGAKVIYLPYTKGTSSTLIRKILLNRKKLLEKTTS